MTTPFSGSGSGAVPSAAPVASVVSSPEFGVVGSVIRLDGRQSHDPNDLQLSYSWAFVDAPPIGSKVVREGFRSLDTDGSVVSFSPDVVGEYTISLKVSNGTYESEPAFSKISVRAILVPHGRGIVPDGKFIWSYLRDVWRDVADREWFETFWSALIQIVGGELLKLYQVDFNKSIRDIQDQFQRRWLSYEPRLLLARDDCSFFLGNHSQGRDALTAPVNLTTLAVILSTNELAIVQGTARVEAIGSTVQVLTSAAPGNIGSYNIQSLNARKDGYRLKVGALSSSTADLTASNKSFYFSLGSMLWTPVDLGVDYSGKYIHFKAGPNAGFYKVLTWDGANVTVDRAPPGLSDVTSSATYKADVFVPVQVDVVLADVPLTDTIVIPFDATTRPELAKLVPGRLLQVGGRDRVDEAGTLVSDYGSQAYRILRSYIDYSQPVPLLVISIDRAVAPSGLSQQNWRLSSTLVSSSQDFEELGVSTGDTIFFDVVQDGEKAVVTVVGQVVGVDRQRLAFHFSTAALVPGEAVSETFVTDIVRGFGFQSVTTNPDGTVSYSGAAQAVVDEFASLLWARLFENLELTPDSALVLGGRTFNIHPRSISRNRLVPVDSTLRSVPRLQEFIVQPTTIERDGKVFQIQKEREYALVRSPQVLTENFQYIIDGEFALSEKLTFKTGSKFVDTEDGDFVDRGVSAGDTFIIDSPVTLAGEYPIEALTGRHSLKLNRVVPLFSVSEFVTAKCRIRRRRAAQYLRFVPGLYSPAAPAPDRLWAEVSFHDNSDSIEGNFGILVGLRKNDLENIETSITYRQAVAGLMYAYTTGSAVDKVRLGVQILLGLPYSEHKGIIRSIDPDYRKDDNGNSVTGRILVEDIDVNGNPLGTQRLYLYPVDESSPDLAGVDTNPATEVAYVVGDTVEAFAALCKGVEVDDYISNPLSSSATFQKQLRQFHSIRVRINDNIFNKDEISLVSSFLKKITPSYISFVISATSQFVDDVNVVDVLFAKLKMGLLDNASLCIPSPLIFGSRTSGGAPLVLVDDGVFSLRRVGRDLSIVGATSVVSCPAGGFVNPRVGEDFEAPLVRAGDKLLLINGDDKDLYPINVVTSDTVLTPGSVPAGGFAGGTGIRYAVLRPVVAELHADSATFVSGDAHVTVAAGGLRTDGVAPGHWLASNGRRFTVKTVEKSAGSWKVVTVTPTPNFNGVFNCKFFNSLLIESPYPAIYTVSSDGVSPVLTSGGGYELEGLLEVGDELQVQNASLDRYVVTDLQPSLSPQLPNGSFSVKLCKKNRPGTPVGLDHLELNDPVDVAELSLISSDATAACVATTSEVNFGGAIVPSDSDLGVGDVLTVTSGLNAAFDMGHGPGVFPVLRSNGTSVFLTVPLPNTESCSWKITRGH